LMLGGAQAAVRIGLATAAKELGSTTSIRISIESNPSRLDAAANDFWPPLWIRTVLLQEGIHPPLETKSDADAMHRRPALQPNIEGTTEKIGVIVQRTHSQALLVW